MTDRDFRKEWELEPDDYDEVAFIQDLLDEVDRLRKLLE